MSANVRSNNLLSCILLEHGDQGIALRGLQQNHEATEVNLSDTYTDRIATSRGIGGYIESTGRSLIWSAPR